MTLTDEEYERLDRQYSIKREFIEEKLSEYPLLEEVIAGNASFQENIMNLDKKIYTYLNRFFVNWRDGLKLFRELTKSHDMIVDLYSTSIPFDRMWIGSVLVKLISDKDACWPRLNDTLHQLSIGAKYLDYEVRKLYAPILFQKNPRLFREVYADMSLEERAYTEHRLYKMLGAGIFTKAGIDEIALQRALHEPELQRQFDNYLDNALAYVAGEKVKDPVTMRCHSPDERFMRTIEERLEPPVSEQVKYGFRGEVVVQAISCWVEGKTFDYTSHERLRRAVEKKIDSLPALKDNR